MITQFFDVTIVKREKREKRIKYESAK